MGMLLALTDVRVGARDAVELGLADGAEDDGSAGRGLEQLEQGEFGMENVRKCYVGEELGEIG